MNLIANPYLHRTAITNDRDFFGRSRELATIFSRIDAAQPQSVSVVGERRIGKSSLLRAILCQAAKFLRSPECCIFVFLDLQEKMYADVPQFFASLTEEIALACRDPAIANQPPTYENVRKLVVELERRGMKLVLLLDEFEALTQSRNFSVEFFNFLRSLPNNHPVSFILTSARELHELCHSREIAGSPFFNIFHRLSLGCFLPEEARELIDRPSRAAGHPLELYTAFIIRMAGYFPFFLQLGCSAFFEFHRQHPQEDQPDLSVIWQLFCEEAENHFEYMWNHLRERERAVCLKIKARKNLSEADRRFLDILIRRGYAHPNTAGSSLFSDAFDVFLETRTAVEVARRKTQRPEFNEMEIAKQVQQRLFPQRIPSLPTLECAGCCKQARDVGGDYYDFLDLSPGRVGLVLADISGKGISAALLMANLQANLRSQCMAGLGDLPPLLQTVNRLFYDSTESSCYATLFFGIYEDSTRRLSYVNCGHIPPLLLRRDGRVEQLMATARVLGMFEDWECSTGALQLGPDDTLVIFTDGITEAMNDDAEEFGHDRFLRFLRASLHLTVASLVDAVVTAVQEFRGHERGDDLTLVVARAR